MMHTPITAGGGITFLVVCAPVNKTTEEMCLAASAGGSREAAMTRGCFVY